MTIKEKLYREYIIEQNRINALKGVELLDSSEEFFSSMAFVRKASNLTKQEWKDKINYAKSAYYKEVKKMRLENYFNTEEGKELKEKVTKRIKEITDARQKYMTEMQNKVETYIKSWLGEEWGVGYLGNGSCDIGIVETITDYGHRKFYFGHVFTLYYPTEYYHKNRFEMNYGCMSSFDLLGENNLRGRYLLGMGKFSTDTERLTDLKTILTEYTNILREWSEEIYKLRGKLENPFDEKTA